MAATETAERRRVATSYGETRLRAGDETKNALKTTEFFAMVAVNAAILIAAWVSDSLNDVRAWTLVAAVATGYIISRGLAKSGSKYVGGEDPTNRKKEETRGLEVVGGRPPRRGHGHHQPVRRVHAEDPRLD
jgi:hypothetical protein